MSDSENQGATWRTNGLVQYPPAIEEYVDGVWVHRTQREVVATITTLKAQLAAADGFRSRWIEKNVRQSDEGEDGEIVNLYWYCDACDSPGAEAIELVPHREWCMAYDARYAPASDTETPTAAVEALIRGEG